MKSTHSILICLFYFAGLPSSFPPSLYLSLSLSLFHFRSICLSLSSFNSFSNINSIDVECTDMIIHSLYLFSPSLPLLFYYPFFHLLYSFPASLRIIQQIVNERTAYKCIPDALTVELQPSLEINARVVNDALYLNFLSFFLFFIISFSLCLQSFLNFFLFLLSFFCLSFTFFIVFLLL